MWLLFDMHNLCHRAFHSTGMLENGVTYGILRDIVLLQERLQCPKMAFCFDLGKSKRYEIYPGYKKRTKPKKDGYNEFKKEVKELRKNVLFEAGFRNIFAVDGFEADDLIGRLTLDLSQQEECIIISTDEDFYQCLRHNVLIFNPRTKKPYTCKSFHKEWGLKPREWIRVKSIAGCPSDTIDGVKGVANLTAAKYLRNELPETHKTYQSIVNSGDLIRFNRRLVRLPFEGTPHLKMKEDVVTTAKWHRLCRRLNMESLRTKVPLNAKAKQGS